MLWPDGAGAEPERPRLFLQCRQECFENFLRQRLSYFDLVRNPQQADFTVLVVPQVGASGGLRRTVSIVRRSDPPLAPVPPVEAHTPPGATVETQREALLDAIRAALYRALLDTEHQGAFRLSLPARDGNALSRLDDPWDYWVLSAALVANGGATSEFHEVQLLSSLGARRITDSDKLRLSIGYKRRFSRYVLDEEPDARVDVAGWTGRALYARSLGSRWAAGSTFVAASDDYENIAAHFHYGPVIEFNVFPYAHNAVAQLRTAYQAGVWVNWYEEVSILGELRELRPYHALTVIADMNHAWGSFQLGTQLNSFIDDPALLRLSGVVQLNVRVLDGLSISAQLEGAWIRDQIAVRRRSPSDVDRLLGTTRVPSAFGVSCDVGLSYTFGSVHNTLVNPRFGRLDLEDE